MTGKKASSLMTAIVCFSTLGAFAADREVEIKGMIGNVALEVTAETDSEGGFWPEKNRKEPKRTFRCVRQDRRAGPSLPLER